MAAGYVKIQGPDGAVIGPNGVPTGGQTSTAALSPAEILAQQMLQKQAQQQHVTAMPYNQGMSTYQQDLNAAMARAQAQLAQQKQQQAQQAAQDRVRNGQTLLDQFGHPNVKAPQQNDPWFNNILGLQDGFVQNPSQLPAGGGQTSKPGSANAFNAPVLNYNPPAPAATAAVAKPAQPTQPAKPASTQGPAGDVNQAMPASVDIQVDPVIRQYKGLLGQYEQQNEGLLFQGDPNANKNLLPDGNTGTSSSSTSSTSSNLSVTYSSLAGKGFGYVLVNDPSTGKLTVESVATALEKLSATAQEDPTQAAELMASLAAMGAYTGGADSYVQNRLYLKGKTLQGQWTKDDIAALANGLQMAVQEQATQAEASPDSVQGIQNVMSQLALKNQNLALSVPGGSVGNYSPGKSSGGSSSRRRSGGGGGGFSSSQSLTAPAIIVDQANQTADSILGRALTPDEQAQFIAYYHQLEAQPGLSLSYASVGIPAEAEAWIKQNMGKDYDAQQYGNYYQAFVNLMQKGLGNTR